MSTELVLYSMLIPCPECAEIGQSHGEETGPRDLVCPACGCAWTEPAPRTSAELVAHLRELLTADCDGSRRRFYNANRLLFDIAKALDAFPELVPGLARLAAPEKSAAADLVLKYSAALDAIEAIVNAEPDKDCARQILYMQGFLRAGLHHHARLGAKS